MISKKILIFVLLVFLLFGCAEAELVVTPLGTTATAETMIQQPTINPTAVPTSTHISDKGDNTTASACAPADGAGTVEPEISIQSITFFVNGVEQVVGDDGSLQAQAGDQVQVRAVAICASSFTGDGGEACVDIVPVDQDGHEIVSEHSGTHLVKVATGSTTISGPTQVWTIDENWREFAVVVNHWPPKATKDLDCGGGRCERDDLAIVRLPGSTPTADGISAQLKDVQTFQGHNGSLVDLVFLPDGEHLASFGSDITLKVWDIKKGVEVRSLEKQGDVVYYAAFSPEGDLLAVEGSGHVIQLIDTESGQLIHTLNGHSSMVMSLAFSPDSVLLATGDVNGLIKVWEVEPGKELFTFQGPVSPVGALAFSADGALLASGSVEGSTLIKLWDLNKGGELFTLEGHADNVYSLAFSPDGDRLASASGDRTLKLWDVTSGQEILTLRGHADRVYSVAYSPDGTLLASGDFRGTIKLWDVESGQELHSLRGHTDLLEPLVFSADGSLLASGSFDGSIKLWGVEE